MAIKPAMESAVYVGQVRHRRFQPRAHAFRYGLFMLYLDLAELDQAFAGRWFWSIERPNLAWFRRADYLGDPALPLDTAVREAVAAQTGRRPAGPIRMLTHLRYYGYGFNPVTFYYCFDATGHRVESIIAEITNTPWNERHAYVLTPGPVGAQSLPPAGEGQEGRSRWTPVAPSPQSPSARRGHERLPGLDSPDGRRHRYRFAKDFHVSPFMPMDIDYDWRFSEPGDRLNVHMRLDRDGVKVFDATLDLERRELTARELATALLRYPFMTVQVIAGIYWQAARIKLKRIPFYDHPGVGNAGRHGEPDP